MLGHSTSKMETSTPITPPPFLEPSQRPILNTQLDRISTAEKESINEFTSQSLEEYKYHPLETADQQIRLLKLRPLSHASGTNKSAHAVYCDLETFDVNAVPRYIALSYTWGSPQPRRLIYVNGQPFHVRTNLYDFLTTFANDTTNIYYIWIDQLCIDQTSINERNHQIRLMSQIYRHCLFVTSWLGKNSEAEALKFSRDPNHATAQALLDNQYFTRVWIVQEIWLAPEVHFLCGPVWIPFNSLATIINDPNCPKTKSLGPLRWLSVEIIHKETLDLDTVLETFARMESSDPHDKIYGLLGLVKEDQHPDVDYNKTLHEAFLDVVKINLILYWKNQTFGTKVQEGKIQLEPAYALYMYAEDLARALGLVKEHISQLEEFLEQIYKIALRRAQRQEMCLVPDIGFHEGQWWCEDDDGRRLHF